MASKDQFEIQDRPRPAEVAVNGNGHEETPDEIFRRNAVLLSLVIDPGKRDMIARELYEGVGVLMFPKIPHFERYDAYIARVIGGEAHLAPQGEEGVFWRASLEALHKGEDDYYYLYSELRIV